MNKYNPYFEAAMAISTNSPRCTICRRLPVFHPTANRSCISKHRKTIYMCIFCTTRQNLRVDTIPTMLDTFTIKFLQKHNLTFVRWSDLDPTCNAYWLEFKCKDCP